MTRQATHIAHFARRLRFTVWTLGLLLTLVTVAAMLIPFPGGPNGAYLTYDGLPRAWAAPVAAVSIGLIMAGTR